MFDVIYYNYYLFYKRFKVETQPELTATFILSISQAFFLNGLLAIIFSYLYCRQLEMWIRIGLIGLIFLINYLIYHKNSRAKLVIDTKPTFLKNKNLSKVLSLMFFIITFSTIFWSPEVIKNILENHCK